MERKELKQTLTFKNIEEYFKSIQDYGYKNIENINMILIADEKNDNLSFPEILIKSALNITDFKNSRNIIDAIKVAENKNLIIYNQRERDSEGKTIDLAFLKNSISFSTSFSNSESSSHALMTYSFFEKYMKNNLNFDKHLLLVFSKQNNIYCYFTKIKVSQSTTSLLESWFSHTPVKVNIFSTIFGITEEFIKQNNV